MYTHTRRPSQPQSSCRPCLNSTPQADFQSTSTPSPAAPSRATTRPSAHTAGAARYAFSRVPLFSRGADFQQTETDAPPGAESEGLDQQLGPVAPSVPPVAAGGSAPPAAGGAAPAAGGAAPVVGAPPPVPQQVPVRPAAPGRLPPPTVTFSTNVRATNTPAGMAANRIPPRVDFPVGVTITNWVMPMPPVVVEVSGSGGTNGTVTVDGAPSKQLFGTSGPVQLRGTAQTAPGSAGNLRLVARVGAQQLAASNPFSVAAIPQDMVLAGHTLLTGPARGFAVTQTWSSDSGVVGDLDEVQVAELVEYITNTGVFAGRGARNSWYIPARGGSLTDTHGTPTSWLTGPGVRVANQTEMFLDNRTGVTDIPMRNSGFVLRRDVTSTPRPGGAPNLIEITTSKRGASVTARGVQSNAGAGNISEPQAV